MSSAPTDVPCARLGPEERVARAAPVARAVPRATLPERWTFIDEIPRTSVGKYDKKTIRSRHADSAYEVVTLG